MAELIANLQARLDAQEQENQVIRQQLAQLTQQQPQVEIPPPPVPAAPAVPVNPEEPLFERFRRMKPPEFKGSTDLLEAEEWLTSLQIILNFMNLTEQEKVLCASYVLKKDARYWWETVALRRNVMTMTWNEFLGEFNEKYYNIVCMRT